MPGAFFTTISVASQDQPPGAERQDGALSARADGERGRLLARGPFAAADDSVGSRRWLSHHGPLSGRRTHRRGTGGSRVERAGDRRRRRRQRARRDRTAAPRRRAGAAARPVSLTRQAPGRPRAAQRGHALDSGWHGQFRWPSASSSATRTVEFLRLDEGEGRLGVRHFKEPSHGRRPWMRSPWLSPAVAERAYPFERAAAGTRAIRRSPRGERPSQCLAGCLNSRGRRLRARSRVLVHSAPYIESDRRQVTSRAA